MFKWRVLAATFAATIGLQPPGVGKAQQPIATIFAIPSQTLTLTPTFATHYVAHDAGFFQKEGLMKLPK